MNMKRLMVLAVLAGGMATSAARAQAPAAPAAAAAKPGFFDRVCIHLEKKRRRCCATPAGQMINKMLTPLSAATGGIIPKLCPAMPSIEDQQKPGVEGAANQAAADAAAAAVRVKAVQILGTFDCHWHPEAEAGLIAALRTDRNECVRLAAAVALNRGCCCTKAVLESLEDCVAGKEKFGPYENSPRVQAAATMALEHCVGCYHEPAADVDVDVKKGEGERKPMGEAPAVPPEDEKNPGAAKPMNPNPPMPPAKLPKDPDAPTTARYSGKPTREQVEHARQTLAQAKTQIATTKAQPQGGTFPSGQRDLFHIASYVIDGGKSAETPAPTAAPQLARLPAAPVRQAVRVTPPVDAPVAHPAGPRPIPAPAIIVPAISAQPPAPLPVMARHPVELPMAVESPKARTVDPTVLRCLEALRDAADPEVRHTAVKTLAACNWKDHPEAVAGLVYAARNDKHAGLRVACVRSLASMKACTPEVMTGLQPMTGDADQWIRHETVQALTYLQTFIPKSEEAAVLQIPMPRASR